MYRFILALFFIAASIFTTHTVAFAAIGDHGATLQYQYEIIQLNDKTFWQIQFEDQLLHIKDTDQTHETLVQFKELIERTQGVIQTIIFFSIYILFIIACIFWFTFTKPQRLKHPFFILCNVIACFFAYIIATNYKTLTDADDNLRYFYLLLEHIS